MRGAVGCIGVAAVVLTPAVSTGHDASRRGIDCEVPPDVAGTPGDDVIGPEGIEEFDYVASYEGDDIVRVATPHVQVCADKGKDQVIALPGAKYVTFYGGAGDDRLGAIEGHVTEQINVYAEGGSDYVVGSGDQEILDGGVGRDQDEIWGMGGRDQLLGGGGPDILFGGSGSDRLVGHNGNDLLKGNKGDSDTAWGEDGEDGCQAEFRHQCEHY